MISSKILDTNFQVYSRKFRIKIFLEEVDDAIIVAGKQADQISKEKHEAGVDDPIVKILEIEDSNPRDMRICSSFTHSWSAVKLE